VKPTRIVVLLTPSRCTEPLQSVPVATAFLTADPDERHEAASPVARGCGPQRWATRNNATTISGR
jgi:hypothetical protein